MDGRREREERAKPTNGRASNLSDGIVAVFSLVRFQEAEMRKALQGNNRSGVCMRETRMKTHDCSRQGRQGYGGLYDDVPNVEMRGWGWSGYLSEHITTLCQMSK